jgi:voltage-gated potassium channel
MKEWILSFSRLLHNSKRYRRTKGYIRDILTNPHNAYKRYFDIAIIFLIVTSVFILVYEVKHPLPAWLDIYDIYFVSVIFAIEYLLRIWVHNDVTELIIEEYRNAKFLERPFNPFRPLKQAVIEKLKYMVTPSAIIDLLAIFPAYRPLRVLRIFVLFRVLKLLRYAKSINQFIEVLKNKRFELFTLLFLLAFIVVTAGIAIYVLEEKINPNIDSLFDAMYWALVTISTVGYGDISPVTPEGRSISIIMIIIGIAMISFATSVIVSAFSEKLDELKENRIIERINKSESFLIICGYGQMTKMFFRQGEIDQDSYIILEKDPERVEAARKDGYNAIVEDASRNEVLNRFNTEHARITILCLIADDIENIYITLSAKSLSRNIRVIVRASSRSMVKKYEHAGADHILLPHEVVNNMIHIAITQPTMYKALHAVLVGEDVARVYEIYVDRYDTLEGEQVESLHFSEYKLLFLGIQRGRKFLFNPPPDEILQAHDVLLVIGRKISINYFRENNGEVRSGK